MRRYLFAGVALFAMTIASGVRAQQYGSPGGGITSLNGDCTAGGVGAVPVTCRLSNGAPILVTLNPANVSNGINVFGDSIACQAGATTQSAIGTGWSGRLNVEMLSGLATLTNYCHSGDLSADMASKVFVNINPTEAGNPVSIMAIGANDADTAENPITIKQLIGAGMARGGLSNLNTIAGSAGTCVGTCTADTTYSLLNGQQSTVNGTTITYTIYTPNKALYLYYGLYAAGGTVTGGSFTTTIDGVLATDTVTGNTSLSSLPLTGTFSTGSALTRAPAWGRFVTTTGSHTVVVTVTSPTDANKRVNILGWGAPRDLNGNGITAPHVYVQGVTPQENDANSTGTAAVNTLIYNLVTLQASDGMPEIFVDVRKWINATTDFAATTTQGCAGSGAGGHHPNDCGHRALANAYEVTLGDPSHTISAGLMGGPVNVGGIAAPTTLDAGTNGDTNASGDQGLTIPRGTWCVIKYVNICWGLTHVQLTGPSIFLTTLTYNSNSGGVAFSGIQSGATIATLRSGIQYKFLWDNSWCLGLYACSTSAGVTTLSGQLIGKGTATNDSAAAGYIGEFPTTTVTSGSAVSLTSATPATIASVALTAGDWTCFGIVDYALTGVTGTGFKSGISTTAATFDAQDTFANIPLVTTVLSDTFGHPTPERRVSLASSGTAYLVGQITDSVGSAAGYGTVSCRRPR